LRAGSPELLDTHETDAFRVVRFAPDERLEDGKGPRGENEDQNLSELALRRCRPPFAAEVQMRDGLPVRLLCMELGTLRALHDNIVWAAGPWRSSGNWWEMHRQTCETEKPQNESAEGSMQAPEWAWDREEWDIALAVTVRGEDRRERETQIGLYRLVRNRVDGLWLVEGSYD